MRLSPGERTEVLIDFATGSAPVLMNTRGISQRILDFAVDDRLKPRITTVPDHLDARSAAVAAPMRTRQFSLNMGGNSIGEENVPRGGHGHSESGAHDFGINGRPFAMDRIDVAVALGSVERWIVRGGGGVDHPFHVHGVHFQVLRNGGVAPRREEAGWKDTVLVSGQAELLIPFTRPASRTHPYMYHCHILEHEDAGMMGQFVVT